MSGIPSDEDIARAKRMGAERRRGLATVSKNINRLFGQKCRLDKFAILDQIDVNFRAYLFFKHDKDIEEYTQNGIVDEIKTAVYEELERVGRGSKDEITVAFEIDSYENVVRNYEGDYYLRLL